MLSKWELTIPIVAASLQIKLMSDYTTHECFSFYCSDKNLACDHILTDFLTLYPDLLKRRPLPEEDDGFGKPNMWPPTPYCTNEVIQDNSAEVLENSSLKGAISPCAAQEVDIGAGTPDTADLVLGKNRPSGDQQALLLSTNHLLHLLNKTVMRSLDQDAPVTFSSS